MFFQILLHSSVSRSPPRSPAAPWPPPWPASCAHSSGLLAASGRLTAPALRHLLTCRLGVRPPRPPPTLLLLLLRLHSGVPIGPRLSTLGPRAQRLLLRALSTQDLSTRLREATHSLQIYPESSHFSPPPHSHPCPSQCHPVLNSQHSLHPSPQPILNTGAKDLLIKSSLCSKPSHGSASLEQEPSP